MFVGLRHAFDQEHRARLLVWLGLALLFLFVVALPSTALERFYTGLDAIDQHVGRGDVAAAKQEIDAAAAFYDRLRAVGLQRLADSYLFRNAFLQRAAHAYLIGDYQTVVQDLSAHSDDGRAAVLLGNAKFKLAQQRYRAIAGATAKAETERAAVISDVIEHINPDYERALRADANQRFDLKWNYDLTSDRDAVRRALQPEAIAPSDLEEMILKGKGTPTRQRKG
jgi:hypothetical protein